METQTKASAVIALAAIPAIGSLCIEQGGVYIGISRGVAGTGEVDAHCFMALDLPDSMSQTALLGWGQALRVGDHADFQIWSRDEAALAYANARDHVDPKYWYHTRTQYSPGRAYIQHFTNGLQYDYYVEFKARARAVRRLPVNPSVL